MNEGDEIKKLLDNGHTVVMYRNPLGSYTAVALASGGSTVHKLHKAIGKMDDFSERITDHFEPTKALSALTDKVLGTGMYANRKDLSNG